MEFKTGDTVICNKNIDGLKDKIGIILKKSSSTEQILVEFEEWNGGHDGDSGIKEKRNCWWVYPEYIEHYMRIDNKSIISLIIE